MKEMDRMMSDSRTKKRLSWLIVISAGMGTYYAGTGNAAAASFQQPSRETKTAGTVAPDDKLNTFLSRKTSQHKNSTSPLRVHDASRSADTVQPTADSKGFEAQVTPMIKSSCIGCHNAKRLKGDLDLERFVDQPATSALKDRAIWTLVTEKLKSGEMPPDGNPKPSQEQISAATKWIEQQYAFLDSHSEPVPGRVTAHRLNRYEYNNTVRDLLGVNLRFADDFPPDPYGYGFDNIGDVLSLSPALTEKYLKAAERVASAAIPLGPAQKPASVRYTSQALGQLDHAHIQTTHDFPVTGLYNFRLGWEQAQGKGTKSSGHLYVDGKVILNQPIVYDPKQDRAFYAKNVLVPQGPHLIEGEIEMAPDSQQPRPLKGKPPYPSILEVIGPFNPIPREQTTSYKRIFFRGTVPHSNEPAYRRQILERLAHRAYRRPVTKTELDQLVSLSTFVQSQGGTFEGGIQIALEAILMSPNFLFRIEQDPPQENAHRISDTELASRLSYFLWSSMPDDHLLSLAETNQLHNPRVLHAEVRRMMADAKAHSLATNFSGQWLQTRNLSFNKPDAKTFPDYDVELRDAMRTETEMFFQAVVTEDRSILDFLDGRFTFVNERLAKLYGIPDVHGRDFRRIELDGTQRSGILTQASVLTASSYPTRTSPVIRGKWVLENILNTPPPPPPPNVPALDERTGGTNFSVRKKLEAHRSNSACAGCHSRMDPLGFGLENYDAIGRWRASEGLNLVDASGVLPDGRTFNGAGELKDILKADAPKFVRALSEKLLTYSLGRGVETSDDPAVKKITQRVETHGYRFSELIAGIVDSVPFQMRQRELTTSAAPGMQAELKH
jgi:PAS domain-containing protein